MHASRHILLDSNHIHSEIKLKENSSKLRHMQKKYNFTTKNATQNLKYQVLTCLWFHFLVHISLTHLQELL